MLYALTKHVLNVKNNNNNKKRKKDKKKKSPLVICYHLHPCADSQYFQRLKVSWSEKSAFIYHSQVFICSEVKLSTLLRVSRCLIKGIGGCGITYPQHSTQPACYPRYTDKAHSQRLAYLTAPRTLMQCCALIVSVKGSQSVLWLHCKHLERYLSPLLFW